MAGAASRNTGRRPRRRLWTRGVVRVFVAAGLLALAAAGLLWQTCGLEGCPDPAGLIAYQPGAAPVLYDRDGHRFATLSPSQHTLVPLDSLPDYVGEAFVAVEDRRFYQHGGVDFRRILGAALADLMSGGVRQGASTITMQLARNLFPNRIPGSERTLARKLLEARVAFSIERRFSKREILELYLNHIYFGDGDYGIDAASRDYFGHPATRLSLPEAATLAALLRNPSYYDPRTHPEHARARRNLVLALMVRTHAITARRSSAEQRTRLVVQRRGPADRRERRLGPYFVEAVRDVLERHFGGDLYGTGLKVYTTLDADVQRAASDALDAQLSGIERGYYGPFRGPRYSARVAADSAGSVYLQGAVVALDVHTGDVLAIVGGRDFRQSHFDRALYARRQVGSAFKPFVYAAALEQGFAPSQLVADEPYRVDLGGHRTWSPTDYENDFEGLMPLRDALVQSRNVPTVRLAQAVGTGSIIDVARDAGITDDIPRSPSMALGTASLTPLELTAAYTTFATLGTRAQPRLITRVVDSSGDVVWQPPVVTRSALSPAVAYVLTDMLRDAVDRGTGEAVRALGFTGPAAGKTGTTQDGRDAWFVGYTPDIVAGIWVGFDRPREIMRGASGGRLAAPVWGRMMRRVYARRSTPWPWSMPDGVVVADVDSATGRTLAAGCASGYGSATHREVFLQGHVPAPLCPRQSAVGWLSNLFRSIFGGRRRAQQSPPSADMQADDTATTDIGHILGAPVLPGTLNGEDGGERAGRGVVERSPATSGPPGPGELAPPLARSRGAGPGSGPRRR